MVLLDHGLLLRTIEILPRRSDQFFNFVAVHGGMGRIHVGVQSVGIQNGKTLHAVIHGTLELNECLDADVSAR